MLLRLKLLCCFCLVCCGVAQSQTIYSIDDFQAGHTLLYVKQDIQDKESSEYYMMYDNSTKKVVLEFGDSLLVNDLSNAIPVSYKELSIKNIWHTYDFDFDGVRDIVINSPIVEDEGCYNPISESYVFLSYGGSFKYSEVISGVYNNIYCQRGGSLEVDKKTKTIITAAPISALSHHVEKYQWRGNRLELIESLEE